MDDSQRILERKALHNVRALVDALEREARPPAHRRKIVIALLAIPVLAIAAGFAVRVRSVPAEEAQQKRHACELEAWNQRAVAFERQARLDHPGWSNPEILDDLRNAQPGLMAQAKAQCAAPEK